MFDAFDPASLLSCAGVCAIISGTIVCHMRVCTVALSAISGRSKQARPVLVTLTEKYANHGNAAENGRLCLYKKISPHTMCIEIETLAIPQ